MKCLLTALAVSILAVACSQQHVVPATCEGIATGVDLIVKNEKKVSDNTLKAVDAVVSDVYPVCTADKQPTLAEAQEKILVSAAKRLSDALSKEGL